MTRYLFTSESINEDSQNFYKDETHAFFNEIFLPLNGSNIMANKISNTEKLAHFSFIKENHDLLSERKIAKRLNLGKTTVNRWSKELGFKHTKHTFNSKLFNKFNEKSSYLLGYICADGNINWNLDKSYWALTITASEKDKAHLEKLRNVLSSTKPLLYATKTKSYRLIVNNKELCQKLMELGITPRKTLTIRFPNIPKTQLKHFIRGIIDGDGNVRYVSRKRSPYFEITIASGSKQFCEGLIAAIKESTGINANVRKVSKNTHVVQYSCSRGEKLAKFIYSGANIFLERKFLPYKNNIWEVD